MPLDHYEHGDPYAHSRGGSDYYGSGRSSYGAPDTDKQHLNTLSIFYFVLAGLVAFGSIFTLLWLALMAIGFANAKNSANGPPPEAGLICLGFLGVLLAFQWFWAYMLYKCGSALREYRSRTFAFTIAILACVINGVPGMILGIFTIIVLNRPSVQALFAEKQTRWGEY
jgi:hypothetical protein